MAMTAAEFLTRFPEFGNIDSDVVAASLKVAENQCEPDVWGDMYAEGVKHLAAHFLALRTQAIGQQVGAIPPGHNQVGFKATKYGALYELLLQSLPSTTGFIF